MEESLGGDKTTHTVADKDCMNAGVYRRGRSTSRDLEVDDYILKPAMGGQ